MFRSIRRRFGHSGSRAAAVLIGMLLALGAGAPTRAQRAGTMSNAAPQATGNVLAYCRYTNTFEIYTIHADGTGNARMLTAPIGLNHHDWSPDCSKLAAVGYVSMATQWSIFTFSTDGTNLTQLTNVPNVWDSEPTWSPDGTKIAFTRIWLAQGNRNELWVMDADGGNPHAIGVQGFGARWSPDGARFVYATSYATPSQIYTCNVDGTDAQRLIETTSNELDPRWSPDGAHIAFVSDRDGSPEIYVMDADGANARQLTTNSVRDYTPRWSPDGQQIAFCSELSGAERWEVYVINVDGTGLTRVTNSPDGATAINPVWRPKPGVPAIVRSFTAERSSAGAVVHWTLGESAPQVRFEAWRADGGAERVKLSEMPATNATEGEYVDATAPATAADYWLREVDEAGEEMWHGPAPLNEAGSGEVIAYCYHPYYARPEIYTIQADGTHNTPVLTIPGGLNYPDWSPDGTRLVATGYLDEAWMWSLFSFNADGSNLVQLTDTFGAWDAEANWSPDGTRIVFSRTYPNLNNRTELWVMNADGSDQQYLGVLGHTAKWSPDGTKLVYTKINVTPTQIFTCNADGTGARRLLASTANDSYPAWSPDGTRIAFASNRSGSNEIYVMNADGTNVQRLTNNTADDAGPRWSLDGTRIAFYSDLSGTGHYEVYVMHADGTGVQRVTTTPGSATGVNPVWRPRQVVPVHLRLFAAERLGDGAMVRWSLGEPAPRSRFEVWRSEGGAARALLAQFPATGATEGEFVDAAAPPAAVAYWLREVEEAGRETWHGPAHLAAMAVVELELRPGSPNPFNPSTTIRYGLSKPTHVTLAVYDFRGRLVRALVDELLPAGEQTAEWTGQDDRDARVASGTYVVRLVTEQGIRTMKVTLAK